MEPKLEHTLRGVSGSQGAGAGAKEDSRRVTTPSWSCLGGLEDQEMNFLQQEESASWSSPAVATSSERIYANRGVKASRWTRQEAVEEGEPPGLEEGAQSRPAAESARLEVTFPKATPLAQTTPLAEMETPPTGWDLLLPECAASAVGSSTDQEGLLCHGGQWCASSPSVGQQETELCGDAYHHRFHPGAAPLLQIPIEIYLQGCFKPLVSISPNDSLFEAVYALIKNRIHRLPILDPVSGTVLYILTHKRLLKFLHIFGALLPRPSFLCRTIQDLGIGTFRDLAVVLETAPILTALDIFVDRRVSALPVVNESGQVVGLYSRFDVIHLAAQQTYNHLDMSVGEALRQRTLCLEGVLSCQPHESLGEVIDRIAREQVHRLVLVDETQHLLGVVSLSDILQALVLSPAGIDALSA
ncbi:5'-AMP-activated protein kinase subunit gamma-3 isoform X3 [Nannospalax galili]|uniref:5'-AMP-activated protein kinase subunit gamma-3 isoform X3 n=1 Tax=Nannospalax galili TaxID=1026970 RepID=UPI000819E1A1|nr:5'-AMP-activated protein kinase subunit gamma-3 isoform X3 [Nannospalax galili]